ncbi:hypothetical protein M405DRAFT_865233 [Rhizopogon salebrosus TDB-379]|nr:hypothetical protein M405DRAFT_865233 [Rhizopogon salebrosus TDB-379]
MSSQHGAYDQALLDEAPAATRAQRQEGYNVDLLDSRPTRPLSTQPFQPSPPPIAPRDIESFSKENIVPPTYAQKSTRSFWRSRNGVITMFVIAVVVLGAVIGGAVGGTVGKNSNNNVSPTATAGIQPDPSFASSPTSSSSPPPTSSTPTPTLTGGSVTYSSGQPSSAGVGSSTDSRSLDTTTVSPSVIQPTPSPSTGQVTQDISSENVVSGDLS